MATGEEMAVPAVVEVSLPPSPPLSVSTPYMLFLGVLVVAIHLADRAVRAKTPKTIVTREFKAFQLSYLQVYLCALGAEWLQDSHLFALLLRHGHSLDTVALLFAFGFVVSYVWGVVAGLVPGGASAVFGRRGACIACLVLYALAALTVFHDDFPILLVGRGLYGLGTALLHSCFEAWMNAEHSAQAFPDEWLVETYHEVSRWTIFVSIGAGVAAELAAALGGSLSAPFVLSLGLCGLGVLLISKSWSQDYAYGGGIGEICGALSSGGSHVFDGLRSLLQLLQTARGAGHVILVQASFETVMFIIMFMWTPTLSASGAELWGIGTPPPYGIIFSLLMASVMFGSLCFQLIAASSAGLNTESMGRNLCLMATLSCLVLATLGTTSHWLGLVSLLAFQFCVGLYYPTIGGLRGKHVPRESRSHVMHSSKTLLVVLVLLLLLNLAEAPSFVFLFCAVLLATCCFMLHQSTAESDSGGTTSSV